MKLLVAEDDPKLIKSLVHILENGKFMVDGVDNGEDALQHAATGEYDGLVLDIMMPGKDGLEVLQELRRKGIKTPLFSLPPVPRFPSGWRGWMRGQMTTCPNLSPPQNCLPGYGPC